jgi:hypothetical protein
MLNQQEAAQIVVDCIRAVSHVPDVDPAGTLDDAGVIDTPRVNNVVTLIVNSTNIGVPSRQHRINAGFFQGVDSDTVVFDVIDIVTSNATPVHSDPLEDFASLVAKHVVSHMESAGKGKSKKGAKKGGGKKSTEKANK